MAIDVGAPCIDRATSTTVYYTYIAAENPANAAGTIDHIDVWQEAAGYPTEIEVAAFYVVSGNNFSTRGVTGTLPTVQGDNNFNAPGDFTAFDINTNDYIGVYNKTSSGISRSDDGTGYWYYSADGIPSTDRAFTWVAARTISLYATGTESGGGYTIEAGSGSFTETGSAVSLLKTSKISIGAGAFTLTGQTVALLKGYALDVDSGSFVYTGQGVGLLKASKISIGAGTFEWTGSAVTLTKSGAGGVIISVGPGTFIITGSSVTLLHKIGDYTIPPPVETMYTEESNVSATYTEESPITTTYTEE